MVTHEFEHVPVEDVVVGEALPVENRTEQLAQERIVWPAVERERPTTLQVRREFACKIHREKQHSDSFNTCLFIYTT